MTTMTTWQKCHDKMALWHHGNVTLFMERQIFCLFLMELDSMYILSLYTSKQKCLFWKYLTTHTPWLLTVLCSEWMKWSCFTRKLCLSPVWVSASALLPCHFTGAKMWTLKMGMLRNTFHFIGIFSDSEVEYHWQQTLIFHLPKHMLQHDWKVVPSPASPCRPSWSAAASSASPRRCSWRGAACGCGCWRSGQVSTVSQPQQSPH